jgi:CDP-diglyceride synthetase
VGVGGQVGDLAESLLKRDAGVKDSSDADSRGTAASSTGSTACSVRHAPLVFVYLDFIVF